MSNTPEFLILNGDGINCERETCLAIEQAGGKGIVTHVNDLVASPRILDRVQGLIIPGGFSFGDELGSGQILALKLKYGLLNEFTKFVEMKRPILGICNGFQVLAKLGLLPDYEGDRTLALAQNIHGKFIDQWSYLNVEKKSKCVWTKDMKSQIELPVRHGEGRVVFSKNKEEEIYQKLQAAGQIALSYTEDINGSYEKIAGICDSTGLILGMMPHPEAYIFKATARSHTNDFGTAGDGQILFDNIIDYIKQS